MRGLLRNKQLIHYANFATKVAITDTEGNETGEYTLTYSTPAEAKANISAGVNEIMRNQFGLSSNCERVMMLDELPSGMTKASVLWVEESDPTKPFDYVVSRIPQGRNHAIVGIRKVKVS